MPEGERAAERHAPADARHHGIDRADRGILGQALVSAGHKKAAARDVAELCIAGVEGALMLARIERSPAPIDRVERRLRALLTQSPTTEDAQ